MHKISTIKYQKVLELKKETESMNLIQKKITNAKNFNWCSGQQRRQQSRQRFWNNKCRADQIAEQIWWTWAQARRKAREWPGLGPAVRPAEKSAEGNPEGWRGRREKETSCWKRRRMNVLCDWSNNWIELK